MSEKLSRIKLVSINGAAIIAPRGISSAEIKNWYERVEEMEALEVRPLSLTAKPDQNARRPKTFAEIIEAKDFTAEDLPMFL